MTDKPITSAVPENSAQMNASTRMLDEVIVLDALLKEPQAFRTMPFHGNAVILEQPIHNPGGPHITEAKLNAAAPFTKMSPQELQAELASGNAKIDKGYQAVAGFRFNGQQFCITDCSMGKLTLDGFQVIDLPRKVHEEIPVHFDDIRPKK